MARRRSAIRTAAALLSLLCLAASAAGAQALPVSAVDPFIGTAGDGNTAPGPQLPFGFANPSPDTTSPSTAGYDPDGAIVGFSQTHVSGTGGAGAYGNFRITPLVGPPRTTDLASPKARERAAAGSYAVTLTRSGVDVRIAAARLAALYAFRFPRTDRAQLLLDVTSAIELPDGGTPLAAQATVVGPRELRGWARMTTGWGVGSYKLHFALRFDRPFARAGTWTDGAIGRARSASARAGRSLGIWATFDARRERTVRAAIGLSFRSSAQAARNIGALDAFDLGRTARRARGAWQRALAPIAVAGGSAAQRTMLATALYHAQLMPHDLTGENVWTRSHRPHYEDYYAVWDTFRTVNPLLTVIDPARAAAIVQSLVDVAARNGGWTSDARVAGNDGITQVGSNADVLIADALAKGLRGIDYAAAYRSALKDATVPSPHPGRSGRELADYSSRGYLSTAVARSASRTLEYGYDDFAVAQIAARLGHASTAAGLRARSLAWRKLWDPDTQSIRPRTPDGAFAAPFDPARETFGAEPFYEGSGWLYSTFVPHDVGGLIRALGGRQAFTTWLDRIFDGGHHRPGNEPGLLAPWLYVHAGCPACTADRVQGILHEAYGPGAAGLPGNDDAGTLSAWYAWASIGLFPNAGQPFYYVTAPLFDRVRLRVGARAFTIATAGTRGGGTRYVASATLNGVPLRRAWITHRQLAGGGTLRLTLSDRPTAWATRGQPPPTLTP